MKKLGDAGLLGVNKPVEYGGMGLDFKFSVALNEELGRFYYHMMKSASARRRRGGDRFEYRLNITS